MNTKIIAVIGDSHTWGQGAGAENYMKPGICGADLRMLSFNFPLYVNLIRQAIELKTGSRSVEYDKAALFSLCSKDDGEMGIVGTEGMKLTEAFSFCRIQFCAESYDTDAEILLDGKSVQKVHIPCKERYMNQCIQTVPVLCESDGRHVLQIRADGCEHIMLYRIECYAGPYAVVNCGVGSCPVGKYQNDFLAQYVGALEPYAILFEGCTINNWIANDTPEQYRKELEEMDAAIKKITNRILWHTDTPIRGEQSFANRPFVYDDYVYVLRDVAKECGIPLADCNAQMNELLAQLDEDTGTRYFFNDVWHPTAFGHYLYAKIILPSLLEILDL